MPFREPLLLHWTPEQAARMNAATFVGQHRLHELPLFDDQHLIATLANHPAEHLGVNSMGVDPVRRDEWREGGSGGLAPAPLLQAVRDGRLWLNLRRVMDHHPIYAELVHALYDQLEDACPGLNTYNRSANLLISSPQAIVYYHLDCPLNMLWHLRGTKRVWAYPLEAGLVSDDTIEGVLCGEKSEELDFRPEWDELAVVHDLEPGEMITWPQHTPHRVVNTGGLNVSLSTEHMTREAALRNNVYLANRHFRALLGGQWKNVDLNGWPAVAKQWALRVVRRIGPLAPKPPQGYQYPLSFEVDPSAPDCVRLIDAGGSESKLTAADR